VKVTGERVVTRAGGFNPAWQRHAAAYVLCEPFLGPGRVLDLGCGVGHSFDRLAPRETVGVDIDPKALEGQERETVVADMRELPFADGSFSSVIAVQSLEHVPDPETMVAEAARVLEPGGVAVFVTPNRLTLGRPDEIIDPYHYVELDAGQLRAMCEPCFGEVRVEGLFGSDRYLELFWEERATLDRLLRVDPLRLRRLVPRAARQSLYDGLLRHYRPADDTRGEAITTDDFELRADGLEQSLDVVAICRSPLPDKRHRVASCAWCGSPLDGSAVRLRGRTRCARCGAATTDPWPSERELESAYAGWYRPDSGRFSFIGDAVLQRTRALLAGRIDRIAPPGPVLDVGAGEGVLVDALQRRGREAVGLERGSRHPLLRDEPLERIEGDWAAVVFWHSLEHLPNPREAIHAAARLLRTDGVLAVAVPNSDSLQAWLFGDRWLHLDPPLHLVHLSQRALIAGLRECGFRLDRVARLRGGQIVIGWLDGLVGRLPGDLSLYQALRRPEARSRRLTRGRRVAALAAGTLLLPLALAGAAVEVALRRPGTVYVEARRA
jgi:SAM-dependent methyltransferase